MKGVIWMNKVLDFCRFIINYSNEQEYDISNLKLQKLLYFVQAYFLISIHELQFIMRINENDEFCVRIRWLYIVTAMIASFLANRKRHHDKNVMEHHLDW